MPITALSWIDSSGKPGDAVTALLDPVGAESLWTLTLLFPPPPAGNDDASDLIQYPINFDGSVPPVRSGILIVPVDLPEPPSFFGALGGIAFVTCLTLFRRTRQSRPVAKGRQRKRRRVVLRQMA